MRDAQLRNVVIGIERRGGGKKASLAETTTRTKIRTSELDRSPR